MKLKFIEKRKEEKKLLKEMEELEREVDAAMPKKEKFSLVDFLLDEDEEEKELAQYLTEEEKQELASEKQAEKRLMRNILIIGGLLSLALVGGLTYFSYYIKSDLEKKQLPFLEKYYQTNLQQKLDITSIDYLCPEDECKDIALAVTKTNNHIISKGQDFIADDLGKEALKKEYTAFIKNALPELNMISNNPLISYQDCYVTFDPFAEYIEATPIKQNFEELYNSGKLVIHDVILYQNNLDNASIKQIVNRISADSVLFFIKIIGGNPSTLTIIKNRQVLNLPIISARSLGENIISYEFNRTQNNISKLSVGEVAKGTINIPSGQEVLKAYQINYETKGYSEEEKKLPTYFMLGFLNNTFNIRNRSELVFFGADSFTNGKSLLDTSKLGNIAYISTGSITYLIGEQEWGIALIGEKTSFWCQFNLC